MAAFGAASRVSAWWFCAEYLLHAAVAYRRKPLSVATALVVSSLHRVGSSLIFLLSGDGPAGAAVRLLPFLEVIVGAYLPMQPMAPYWFDVAIGVATVGGALVALSHSHDLAAQRAARRTALTACLWAISMVALRYFSMAQRQRTRVVRQSPPEGSQLRQDSSVDAAAESRDEGAAPAVPSAAARIDWHSVQGGSRPDGHLGSDTNTGATRPGTEPDALTGRVDLVATSGSGSSRTATAIAAAEGNACGRPGSPGTGPGRQSAPLLSRSFGAAEASGAAATHDAVVRTHTAATVTTTTAAAAVAVAGAGLAAPHAADVRESAPTAGMEDAASGSSCSNPRHAQSSARTPLGESMSVGSEDPSPPSPSRTAPPSHSALPGGSPGPSARPLPAAGSAAETPFDPGPGPGCPGCPLSGKLPPYRRYEPYLEALATAKSSPRSYMPFLHHHVAHMKLKGVEPSMIQPGYQQRLRELLHRRTGRWLSHVYVRPGCIELVLDCEEWGSGVLTHGSACSSWSPHDSYGPAGSVEGDADADPGATGGSATDGSAAGSEAVAGGSSAGLRSGRAGGTGRSGCYGRGGGSTGGVPEDSPMGQGGSTEEAGPAAEAPGSRAGQCSRPRTLRAPRILREGQQPSAVIAAHGAAAAAHGAVTPENRASQDRRTGLMREAHTAADTPGSALGRRHMETWSAASTSLMESHDCMAGGLGAWEVVEALQLQLPQPCGSGGADGSSAGADGQACGRGGGGAALPPRALAEAAMSLSLLEGGAAAVASAAVGSALGWAALYGDSGAESTRSADVSTAGHLMAIGAGNLEEGNGSRDAGREGAVFASANSTFDMTGATMSVPAAPLCLGDGQASAHQLRDSVTALGQPRIDSLEPRVLVAGQPPPQPMTAARAAGSSGASAAASVGAASNGPARASRGRSPARAAAVAAASWHASGADAAAAGAGAAASMGARGAGGSEGVGLEAAESALTLQAVVRCSPQLLGSGPLELLVRSEGRYLPALISSGVPAAPPGGDDAAAGDDTDGRLVYNIQLPLMPPSSTSSSTSTSPLRPGIILVDLRVRDVPVHAAPVVVVRDAAMALELREALATAQLSDDDRDSLLMDLGTWVFHAAEAAARKAGETTVRGGGGGRGQSCQVQERHPRHVLHGGGGGAADHHHVAASAAGAGERRRSGNGAAPGLRGARAAPVVPPQPVEQPGLAGPDPAAPLDGEEAGGGERLGMLGLHLLRFALAAGWWCTAASLAADLVALGGVEGEATTELRAAATVAATTLAAAAASGGPGAEEPRGCTAEAADLAATSVAWEPSAVLEPGKANALAAASAGLPAAALQGPQPAEPQAASRPATGVKAAAAAGPAIAAAAAAAAGPSSAVAAAVAAPAPLPQWASRGPGPGGASSCPSASSHVSQPARAGCCDEVEKGHSGPCSATHLQHPTVPATHHEHATVLRPGPTQAVSPRGVSGAAASLAIILKAGGTGPLRRRALLRAADSATAPGGHAAVAVAAAAGPAAADPRTRRTSAMTSAGEGDSGREARSAALATLVEGEVEAEAGGPLSAASALLVVLGLRQLPPAEESGYRLYSAPRIASQGYVITTLDLVALAALLLRGCWGPSEIQSNVTLLACWVGVVEALLQTAGGAAVRAMWSRVHQVCKVVRYVSYLTTKVLCTYGIADMPNGIDSYVMGVALLVQEGIVHPASALLPMPILTVLSVLRVIANSMLMSMVDTKLQGGRLGRMRCTLWAFMVSITEMLTSVALHVYFRVSYSRRAAGKRRFAVRD